MDISYYKLLLRYEIVLIENRMKDYFSKPISVENNNPFNNKYVVVPNNEIEAFINYEITQLKDVIQSRFGLSYLQAYKMSEEIISELFNNEYQIQKKVAKVYQTFDNTKSVFEYGIAMIIGVAILIGIIIVLFAVITMPRY